jgi:WD40 repeat protein
MRLNDIIMAVMTVGISSMPVPGYDTVDPIADYAPFSVLYYNIAYSQDGMERVEGCTDGKLRVYNVETGALLKETPFPRTDLYFISKIYSTGNQGFIMIRADSLLFWFDVETGIVSEVSLPAGVSGASAAYFSRDGKKIIFVDYRDTSFTLWDVTAKTGKKCFGGYKKPKNFAVFTPDGSKILVLTQKDSTGQLRDAFTDSVVNTYRFSENIRNYASFSNDASTFLLPMYGSSRCFGVIDVATGDMIRMDTTIQKTVGWGTLVTLSYSPDDSKIIAGDVENAFVIDAQTGGYLAKWSSPAASTGYDMDLDKWFSPDGKTVIMPFYNNGAGIKGLRVLDVETKKATVRHEEQERPDIKCSGFSEIGQPLFTGTYLYEFFDVYVTGLQTWDSTVFWNGATGKEFMRRVYIRQPQGRGNYFNKYIFTPDGRFMIREQWYKYNETNRTGIAVHDLSDSGRVVCSGKGAVSRDGRYACLFDNDTCTTIDLHTGDSSKAPFPLEYVDTLEKLPQADWKVYLIAPAQDLICAYYMIATPSTESTAIMFGIWKWTSRIKVCQFPVASLGWFYKSYYSDMVEAEVTNDGSGIFIATSDGVRLFDTRNGAILKTFTDTNKAISMTPAGDRIIIGNVCYNVSTGDTERVFNGISGKPCFNPLNRLQFIAGSQVWELTPSSVNPSVKPLKAPGFRIKTIKSRNAGVEISGLPVAGAATAALTVYSLDGRKVAGVATVLGAQRRTISLPDLARGVFIYRLEIPSCSFTVRGKFHVTE